MRVADFDPSATINDLKLKTGPAYLFAKKRKWVTSLSLLAGETFISREDLQAVLCNLGAARTLRAPSYTLETLLELNLDGEHDVWVALGQSMPLRAPANPKFYRESRLAALPDLGRPLSDYLPLVGGVLYRCAEVPNPALYLTQADPGGPRTATGEPALVSALAYRMPSRSNYPVPLNRAFETLHATEHVPVLQLNSRPPLARVFKKIDFQTNAEEGSLTCVFGTLLCDFLVSGDVALRYAPSKPAPLAVCRARIAARLNPFLERLNRALGSEYAAFSDFDRANLVFDPPAGGGGLKEERPLPADQLEVFDFQPAHECRYAQTTHPAAGVRAGALPLGIQAFLMSDAVRLGRSGSFMDCVSELGDFRTLVGDLDPRFSAYPDVRAAFATNPRHPLLQCCARDNFIRFLRSEPDHTYLWDLVCRPGVFPDGLNLVLFAGECAHEAVVLHKGGCPFDPARRSLVLWRRGALYTLLRTAESPLFSFSDFDFLKKMQVSLPQRPPLTAAAVLHKLDGRRVEHRGRVVGVLAEIGGKVGFLPCAPAPAPKMKLQDASAAFADLPPPSLKEARAFLEAAARALPIACRPAFWVQAPGGACVGVLTEGRLFAPCAPAAAPKDLEAVALHDLKHPYPARCPEATLQLVAREWPVERVDALPPALQTYPRYVRRKLLVPKHLRLEPAPRTVVANGAEHDLAEGETLY